ncbi:MAG TPA: sigma-70 family RNA polymerase sigma factor [Puia sp.]|jgi:RNA polymerase sigma-70 factor (ECF subfamily)|nr:sigma-70 family RNA polymerase sigma factor [Puia sp.]
MNLAEQLEDARSGSAAAQKCLFDHLADPMMALCCRYVKNRADAEELLLDGFYKFFKHLKDFRYHGEAALYAWIRTIMVRECLMFLRRQRAFSMLSAEPPAGIAPDTGPEPEPLAGLSAAEIFDLIVRLPVGYRTVFNLYVIEGMEHKEIAKALGVSEGTSKSQLSKARALLQKMLLQKGILYVRRKTQ